MVSHEPSSVYPAREDTLLLVPFARAGPGRTVLDLGTGNGRLALEAARSGSRVVATDLNPHALRALRARAGPALGRLELVRTDLARGLGRFDRVLANPPYLPTSAGERDPDRWTNLALDGGPDGCRVLRRILRALPAHLRPRGAAYVLVSSVQRPGPLGRAVATWRARGGTVRRVARRDLEGEVLSVLRLGVRPRPRAPRRPRAGRAGRPPRGSGGRRRNLGKTLSGSSRGPAAGRTTAPGGASDRRRSRSGS